MKHFAGAVAFVAAFALSSIPVGAHDGASGVVKERMEAMKSIAGSLKAIKEELAKGESYAPAEVKRHADAIASHAGDDMTRLFPEGSAHGPSEAKAEIWTAWGDFRQRASELKAAASSLGAAAAPGAAPSAEFATVVNACAGCHKAFREKR